MPKAQAKPKLYARSEGSSAFIELAFRTPSYWICDPAVDIGFMPAGAVGADFKLSRERTLGDLTVDGRPGQPRSSEDGFQTNNTVWFRHGRAAFR
jgi:hypothetical protein